VRVPEKVNQHHCQFDRNEKRRTDDELFPDKKRLHLCTSSALDKGKAHASADGSAKSREQERLPRSAHRGILRARSNAIHADFDFVECETAQS
jgi:hypothetical protein